MSLHTITDLASGHVEIGRHGGHGRRRRSFRGRGRGFYSDLYDGDLLSDDELLDELPEGVQYVLGDTGSSVRSR